MFFPQTCSMLKASSIQEAFQINQTAIGNYIARKRKEQNLTQEQLAEQLSVSNKTISKWENGKCMPDYSIIQKLCEAIHVTLPELMDGEDAADSAMSGTVGGTDVQDFVSGILMGLSIVEILAGIGVAGKKLLNQ